ncbi:MAG: iron chelate uptake ABC transporter family permease subunit [Gordonia sp. (in: high G+C Gram-positive bacteria)]|uniref:FecCD family ABC transporter permease n=1 Tax=Gordonia sp. (in: high G+C Gram-positive bacteria) TaxID=84139 RepID=UPI0039E66804
MSAAVDFGRPQLVVRTGRLSQRWDRRTLVVGVVIAALLVLAFLVGLLAGDDGVGVADLPGALLRGGSPEGFAVRGLQLPRVWAAIVLGAAMALSGGIFQLLTRNPLGSPDLIGFGVGSYTGALIASLVVGLGFAGMSAFALIGGLLTAGAVYLLAYRGGVGGFRLVITGVAISAMLAAVNYWLILRSDLDEAMLAAQWGAGTLDTPVARNWTYLVPAFAISGALAAALAVLAPRARIMELGPQLARALGAQTRAAALALPVIGVALIAVATTICGPVAFVALSAPHIARRLCRSGTTPWVVTALVGALLLLLSDIVAQQISALVGGSLPVGVVTVCVGGGYLCYLLYTEMRRTRA